MINPAPFLRKLSFLSNREFPEERCGIDHTLTLLERKVSFLRKGMRD